MKIRVSFTVTKITIYFEWNIYLCVTLFQGTIASIFNDSTTLGRRYVFDIRRTCREVYDRARRAAHAQQHSAAPHDSRARRRTASGSEQKVCWYLCTWKLSTIFTSAVVRHIFTETFVPWGLNATDHYRWRYLAAITFLKSTPVREMTAVTLQTRSL